jgi:hypothetical protein
MMSARRNSIFLLNGIQDHWIVGRRNAIWGLPIRGNNWSSARACLQELGFIAGTEVLAITGPYAHFRAVIGSDRGVYYDDSSAPFGLEPGPGSEAYPVRIELTNIQDIKQDWFSGPRGDAWREPLQDVYFSRRSLYLLPPECVGHRYVRQSVVFGTPPPVAEVEPPTPVPGHASLENDAALAFSQIGYRVEQLGHKRPLERVPDGIGMLSRALIMYAKSLGTSPYFVLWDCKFDCPSIGLKAGDERAIKEYIEAYAPDRKAEAEAGEFWFLIVARDRTVADKIHSGVSQWAWPSECHVRGLRGLRVISLPTLQRLAKRAVEHRQSGGDPDAFLVSLLPREFAKPYLG